MDYKQTGVSGTSWQRCFKVGILNPLNGAPAIFFEEEVIFNIGDSEIKKPVGSCYKPFSGAEAFPLLNPETNEPLGALMTHEALYVALYSLYMQTAAERDAAG